MRINYGLILAKRLPEGNLDIRHFVGFENRPSQKDRESLLEELRSDPEFSDILQELDNLRIMDAPLEVVRYYSDMAKRFKDKLEAD